MAGVRIKSVRQILQYHALELRGQNENETAPLDSIIMLDFAEAYAAALAEPNKDLSYRASEIKKVRDQLQRDPVRIPPEVRKLIVP
jgi:hypothetical protein